MSGGLGMHGLAGIGAHQLFGNMANQRAYQAQRNASDQVGNAIFRSFQNNVDLMAQYRSPRPPLTEHEQQFVARVRRMMAILEQQIAEETHHG